MKCGFVYLIGFAGCGKLTIAQALRAQWPCILVDNHLVNNVILSLVDPDGRSKLPAQLWANVRRVRAAALDTIRDFAKPGRSFAFTNELIEGDPDSLNAFLEISELAHERGAVFLPVRLTVAPDELERRVVSLGRAGSLKATDGEAARTRASSLEVFKPTGAPYLELDVTHLSPEQAADGIVAELRKVGAA